MAHIAEMPIVRSMHGYVLCEYALTFQKTHFHPYTQYRTFLIYVSSVPGQNRSVRTGIKPYPWPAPTCTPPISRRYSYDARGREAAYIALSVAISSAVSANEESARSSAMYTGFSPGLVVI